MHHILKTDVVADWSKLCLRADSYKVEHTAQRVSGTHFTLWVLPLYCCFLVSCLLAELHVVALECCLLQFSQLQLQLTKAGASLQ